MHQVKAISQVDPAWSTGPRVGVCLRPIAPDDLKLRMRLELRRDRGRLLVGQQIDHALTFKVNKNRPIAVAALHGLVIHA